MMKIFLFLSAIAVLFLISCSNKFNDNNEHELELLGIVCGQSGSYIYALANISSIDDAKYYYSYWIIDGEFVSSSYNNLEVRKKVSYGEHFLKFVLIDNFGDTLSESCYDIRVNEPLKITLLSPVEKYEAAKTDTIAFQYKISGIDVWEENPQITIYISTIKDSLWKEGKIIENNFWIPTKEQTYYWGIKAFTEQDSTFSEIRSICIKK